MFILAQNGYSAAALHHWLVLFLALNLLKLLGGFCLYRTLMRHDDQLNFLTVALRYSTFLADTVWAVWFVYGNAIYYMPTEPTNFGIVLPRDRMSHRLRIQSLVFRCAHLRLHVHAEVCTGLAGALRADPAVFAGAERLPRRKHSDTPADAAGGSPARQVRIGGELALACPLEQLRDLPGRVQGTGRSHGAALRPTTPLPHGLHRRLAQELHEMSHLQRRAHGGHGEVV